MISLGVAVSVAPCLRCVVVATFLVLFTTPVSEKKLTYTHTRPEVISTRASNNKWGHLKNKNKKRCGKGKRKKGKKRKGKNQGGR